MGTLTFGVCETLKVRVNHPYGNICISPDTHRCDRPCQPRRPLGVNLDEQRPAWHLHGNGGWRSDRCEWQPRLPHSSMCLKPTCTRRRAPQISMRSAWGSTTWANCTFVR